MNILILGLNYAPEPVGIGPYTTGAAQALAQAGHDVCVVSGKAYYPYWQVHESLRAPGVLTAREEGVEAHRVPIYVPAVPTGAKRLVHHLSFALRAAPVAFAAARRKKFDVMICIAPSLISMMLARAVARAFGIKLWLHIQDFEVEAAFATGLLKERGLLAKLARAFEKWNLRADRVSTISPQMCAKLADMGVARDKIVEWRNWANIDDIQPLDRPSRFRLEWGLGQRHVAVYSGNIGNKQGIEIIVEAAHLLRDRKDLVFLICGNGSSKDKLIAAAQGLDNVRFMDLLPKEDLGELLGLASVHLLPQIAGAADLVLPSKLTNMLASGRAVLATADAGTGLAGEVEGCGIITPPEDARAFADAIVTLIDNPQQREMYGRNARIRAEERWSKTRILADFEVKLAALAQAG
jgi:colanic acid biosynthesis glycosyl transferase WcaI